jgi:hypothetical protein
MYGDSSVASESLSILKPRGINFANAPPLNKTCSPDEFLNHWRAMFLIRYSAMMLPSLFRACHAADGYSRPNQEPLGVETMMRWIRILYNYYYAAHLGSDSQWPVVLDARRHS